MYKMIVVGANRSESARRAVAEAIELGAALGAKVHLVAAFADDLESFDGKDSRARVDAQRNLDAMVPAAGTPNITTSAQPGDPAKVILDVAGQVGADLIVVGNKGMRGKGRFLGSVPSDVAHRANCAVLVVRSA